MRNFFLFCAALLTIGAQAEDITLNLYTAVNTEGQGIDYNSDAIMDSTYSEDYRYQFIYTNDYDFMFSHLPSGSS